MGTMRRALERKARADAVAELRHPRPWPPRLRKWPVAVAAGKLHLVVGEGRVGLLPRVVGVRRLAGRPATRAGDPL